MYRSVHAEIPAPICDLCILLQGGSTLLRQWLGAKSPPEKVRPGPVSYTTLQLLFIINGLWLLVKRLAIFAGTRYNNSITRVRENTNETNN